MMPMVMVVDDDEDIRSTLSEVLEDEGYQVLTAGHGAEALRQLHAGAKPSVILLDLMMPVMNGQEFVAQRQKVADFASIPVLIITADGNISQKAGALGVFGYVKKPFNIGQLLDAIEQGRRFATDHKHRPL